MPIEDSCPYFNGRLSAFQREKGIKELVKLVVEIGKHARISDQAFCEAMGVGVPWPFDDVNAQSDAYPSYNVIHGECSLMKLTDRFMFGKQNFYSFIKLAGYDEAAEPILSVALQPGAFPEKRLLKLTGPSGMGKSFYLQYIVRRLRVRPDVCALYLANPELFLLPDQINFGLILMELLYSIADCIDEEMISFFTSKLEEINSNGKPRTKFRLVKQAFKEVMKYLKTKKKTLFIVLDQENVYERHKEKDPASIASEIHFFLTYRCHDSFVLSSLSFTSKSVQETPNTKRLVRMLSDVEILSILRSRCSPAERCLLFPDTEVDNQFAHSMIDLVLSVVGRCPRDLHHLLNIEVPLPRQEPTDSDAMSVTHSAADTTDISVGFHDTGMSSEAGSAMDISDESIYSLPIESDQLVLYTLLGPELEQRCKLFPSGTSSIIAERHEKFFNALGTKKQEAFLLMLSIADKSPPLGKNGLYIYDILPSKPKSLPESPSSKTIKSDDSATMAEMIRQMSAKFQAIRLKNRSQQSRPLITREERSNIAVATSSDHANTVSLAKTSDTTNGFVDISFFSQIDGLTDYANVAVANSALDGRYFFIDQNNYVHPFSDRVLQAIRDYHQKNSSLRMQKLLEPLGDDVAFAGPLFEFMFFTKFSDKQSAFVLDLHTAASSTRQFTKLKIPICTQVENLDFKKIFDKGDNVIYKCPPGFPVIDFCIVCPNHTLSNADIFNMLSNFPWIEADLKVRKSFKESSTLFLGQIAINSVKHDKGDLEIALDPSKALQQKMVNPSPGDDKGKESVTRRVPKKDPFEGNEDLKKVVRSYVNTSIEEGLQPHVNFIWITRAVGPADKYHSQSILCSNYSIVKKSLPEVRRMKMISIKSKIVTPPSEASGSTLPAPHEDTEPDPMNQ